MTTVPTAAPARPNAPAGTASAFTTLSAVAVRTALKIARSPQILGIAIIQSVLFLLMFRYVLGGAIGVPGLSPNSPSIKLAGERGWLPKPALLLPKMLHMMQPSTASRAESIMQKRWGKDTPSQHASLLQSSA